MGHSLNFICQTNEEGYLLATTTSSSYGNIGTGSSGTKKTGEYKADNYSNIHDMLGNNFEWTTEYTTYNNYVVARGGNCSQTQTYAAYHYLHNKQYQLFFRSQIYIK